MKEKKAGEAPAASALPRGRESGGGRRPRKRSRDSSSNGDVDRISNLPDAILGSIISLLPTKDGARTQAIARRWRPLWRTAPLNLSASYDLRRDAIGLFSVVSKILSDHHGPARRFCFRAIPLHEAKKRFPAAQAQVDAWFHSRALAGLQELDVGFDLLDSTSPGNERRHQLPPSVFRCGSTLVEARIGSCDFPKAISPPCLSFPLLKKLSLNRLSISADVFRGILSACHVLDSLYLQEILRGDHVGCLQISSPTLRTVGISACFPGNNSGEIIIEDAPRFHRLLLPSLGKGGETIRVTGRAPNLEILGPLSPRISEIQIHNLVFQSLAATSLRSTISTVKVLALELPIPDLNHVIHVLRCFPCLEKLHVIRNKYSKVVVSMKEKARHHDPLLDPVKCLDTHLKMLVLADYEGTQQDVVSFAKFFILNAKLLKLIKFELKGKVNKEWVADQLLVLPETGSGASPCVQLEFGAHVCSYFNPFWYL